MPIKTINVTVPGFRDPTFKTAQEAIAETARRSRGPVSVAVRGQRITDVLWNGTQFFACLEGQSGGLRIQLQGDVLAVDMPDEIPDELRAAPSGEDQEVVLLHRESGIKTEWDRATLAAKLKGKTVHGLTIWVSRTYLTIRESPAICFWVLLSKEPQAVFLHWDEER
jgi:hypothetical protein